ncbi:MAG: bifunctional precorrin-2 dehydrogenase/sirohydrochlorin ferrochelatase [Thermosediminibacteraceae bacterium]|nr:bifunctional precorrin-2 dehydrogenase/sirohydrochlorin ferrochelatase [Thermosediminibacteraceae bacterium]PZN03631.1 MAG: siroheme synthase [Bacillota bacterium]
MALYFPLMINLKGKRCLVVGAGGVAARKVKSLLECEAQVTVVSKKACSDIEKLAQEGKIKLIEKSFSPEDLDGNFLVFAASDDPITNRLAAIEAAKRGIPVNVADSPELSTFIVPSFLRKGHLTISVSTGGKSPRLARRLKEWIESNIPSGVEELLSKLEKERSFVKKSGLSMVEKVNFYDEIIDRSGILKKKGDIEN